MPVLDTNLFERERKRQRLSVVDVVSSAGMQAVGMTVGRYDAIVSGAFATEQEIEALAAALGVKASDIHGGES